MNLYEAIRDNNTKRVKSILGKNRHAVNITRAYGSPLLVSAEGGYIDIIKLLLKYGADPNSTDSNGWTPLISACQFNHFNAALLLLENDANPHLTCHLGNTALHAAARNDNVKIMQALIDAGCEIDIANADGWTALHSATHSNRINAAKFLLDKGADVAIRSKSGRTPYDTAVHMRLYDLAHVLRKYQQRQTDNDPTTQSDSNNNTLNKKPTVPPDTRKPDLLHSFARKLGLIKADSSSDKDDKQGGVTTVYNRNSTREDSDDDDEGIKNECPICFEIPLPPTHIYQCTNGHIYCGKCKKKPNMRKCPQCGINISGMENRNRYAEENIAELYKKKKI